MPRQLYNSPANVKELEVVFGTSFIFSPVRLKATGQIARPERESQQAARPALRGGLPQEEKMMMATEQGRRKRPGPGVLLLLPVLVFSAVLLTGCPLDNTPPSPVTNFTATAGDAQVTLAWANPTDSDLQGVRIQRKTGSPPTGPTDGATVFEAAGTQHTDTTAANGTLYFYAAYAYDKKPNYSAGAFATATPTSATAQADVLEQMVELAAEIATVPPDILPPGPKAELLGKLGQAELEYRGGLPCDAGQTMEEYMGLSQDLREGAAVPTAEDLYNQGRMIRWDMLMGAPVKSDCPGAERVGLESDAAPVDESNNGLNAEGTFGEPIVRTLEVDTGGKAMPEVFTQVTIPGMNSLAGAPGMPGVPVFRRLVAAPRGSQVQLMLGKATPDVAETVAMNLYPAQESPVDQTEIDPAFADKPFVRNGEIYASDEPYPSEPVSLKLLGDARGVQIYLLEVAGGQYRPKSNLLTLFRGVNADVSFTGGTGAFLTEDMAGPFEDGMAVLTSGALNRLSVQKYLEAGVIARLRGEELLILTHPNFRAAADTLAVWKRAKGISTTVFECGTGSGITGRTTNEEIDAFIENRYATAMIRPSYVLLLGDAEFIAPFYISGIGTDWPYAILGDVETDRVPDFAVGRIPVDTLEQANTVVAKIVAYEHTPPVGVSFYGSAAVASQFQCCRTDVGAAGTDQRSFIEVSEFARNVMTNAGKAVDRIYTMTGSGTPARYYNGTLLPAAIGSGSGFAWGGTTAGITAAINAGRFLVMHRDHGWQEGWSHPAYELPNVDDLTNGAFTPVVFSVNCASGFWDNETAGGAYGTTVGGVYFAEKLLRKSGGGAVGILGDTRNSPSWANSTLTQGFFDSLWANALPAFGGGTAHRRLGDILNHGKMYLMSQVGLPVMGVTIDEGSAVSELYLWHCLGDPTLEVWTRNPYAILLPNAVRYRPLTQGVNLEYPQEGAEVTVFLSPPKGLPQPIGRGFVREGVANIPFLEPFTPEQGTLLFSAALENSVAKLLLGKADL